MLWFRMQDPPAAQTMLLRLTKLSAICIVQKVFEKVMGGPAVESKLAGRR